MSAFERTLKYRFSYPIVFAKNEPNSFIDIWQLGDGLKQSRVINIRTEKQLNESILKSSKIF